MDCFSASAVYREDFTDVFFICYHRGVPGDAEWRFVGDLLLVFIYLFIHLS